MNHIVSWMGKGQRRPAQCYMLRVDKYPPVKKPSLPKPPWAEMPRQNGTHKSVMGFSEEWFGPSE